MERRKIEDQFKKKLKLIREKGKKHWLYYVFDGRQYIARTQISRTHQTISENILGEIADQLFLNISELKDAINCPMTKEEFYSTIIRRVGEKFPS
ncbi:MAG: hypothetical protein Q7V48_04350 [Deltaproteobacteria bacterium]|nr:hypothetical protein [Deltaproteobacteria bacterium]